jgi:hypothetical protein
MLGMHFVRVTIIIPEEVQERQDEEQLRAFLVRASGRQRHNPLSEYPNFLSKILRHAPFPNFVTFLGD